MRSVIIRVIAGGYLAYLGYTLIKGYISGDTGSSKFFMIIGCVFVLIGICILYTAKLAYSEEQKRQTDTISEADEKDEEEEIFIEAKAQDEYYQAEASGVDNTQDYGFTEAEDISDKYNN